MHDRQPAQQLLHRRAHGIGVVAHQGQLIRVLQQRQGAEAEHVGGGLVTGHQ